MANPEHVETLKRGVQTWNRWRRENAHPIIRPDLSGTSLSGLNLRGAYLRYTDLSRSELILTNLRGAELIAADLSGTNLDGANLGGANLTTANLRAANLRNADLGGVNFSDADLGAAILSNASLKRANLAGANLTRADLSKTDFDRTFLIYTVFAANNLSTSKNLDTVIHYGPTEISISTIYKSGGNIPETFLRGCGVPETFITFARSLVNSAIDYYSTFISYSSKNADIAERLYADLQARGVRCWFAPEDIKIGDRFRQRIDEAIRIHDKLLVVLSEDSINSAWVEDEVEAALERERRENRLVLFPVRIDDAVINSDQAWAASLRRVRHIGDFSRWKDHDSYSKAFARLLRDLKAEDKA